METQNESYDRGVAAGQILERLSGHDQHFAQINGSMGRIADEMHELVLQVQRLGDSANADRSTVRATAAALKEADEARRQQGVRRWSPFQRVMVAVGATAALLGDLAYLLSTRH
jgi:hypothetical protein